MRPHSIGLLLFAPTVMACWWPSDWGCHGHGRWSWGSCKCDANFGGSCCDTQLACGADMADMCPFDHMTPKSHKCSEVDATGPIRVGTAPLPPQLRGVFWLAEQGDSSALMSFAHSEDGAGLSQGTLALSPPDGYHYKIRVGGDKVWSFHDKASSWSLVELLDLVYKFTFDSPTNPTTGQIIPSGENLNGFDLNAPWLLNFAMKLIPMGNHSKYANSWVWGRPSSVLGFEGGYYDLIQVLDETGAKIEPAYSDWLAYCSSAETGSTPGQLWYREASPVA